MNKEIKKKLYQICEKDIDDKIAMVEQNIASIIDSRNNETKSSAGDKFETGRAMMQMEEGKNKSQLMQLKITKNELLQIRDKENAEDINAGSLVETNKGIFYISIGLGKVIIDDATYYCISNTSPISLILREKRVGDEVVFNQMNYKILSVI
ncbi:MAG: hypothetical protein ACI94Y_001249 [Maribacter sp.]|jgi:hypothetical protein